METVELALKYKKLYPQYVVGIDFSGNPNTNKFKDFIIPLK